MKPSVYRGAVCAPVTYVPVTRASVAYSLVAYADFAHHVAIADVAPNPFREKVVGTYPMTLESICGSRLCSTAQHKLVQIYLREDWVYA